MGMMGMMGMMAHPILSHSSGLSSALFLFQSEIKVHTEQSLGWNTFS
jgi:hypothetical protein